MITKCRLNSLHPDAFQLDYRDKYKSQPPLCILFIELLAHLDRANYVRLKVVKLQTFIFRFCPTFLKLRYAAKTLAEFRYCANMTLK